MKPQRPMDPHLIAAVVVLSVLTYLFWCVYLYCATGRAPVVDALTH